MTAIMDLVVFQRANGEKGQRLYEPRWLFTDFTDTAGVHADSGSSVVCPGKEIIWDAMFGDGHVRYRLESYRPMVLANERQSGKMYRFSARHHPKKRYLAVRTKFLEIVHAVVAHSRMQGFCALSLKEFLGVLDTVPQDSAFWSRYSTIPMTGFLRASSGEDLLVLPVMGRGLAHLHGDLMEWRFHRCSIIQVVML